MLVRDAVWEKRNLGVVCKDIFVDAKDTSEELIKVLDTCNSEYQVLHVEAGNVDSLLKVQTMGFQVIEMNVQLVHSMGEVKLPTLFSRFEKMISYRDGSDVDVNLVLEQIRDGEMFLTDKIANDPLFGRKKAGERYYYWCKDVLDTGGKLVMADYKNETIGFEVYSMDDKNICTNIVGGVFPKYANKGLGFLPLYVELLDQQSRGAKKVCTAVSSNNLPVFKLHEMLGYRLDKISYILVKHMDGV